jgi:hypothetical protein
MQNMVGGMTQRAMLTGEVGMVNGQRFPFSEIFESEWVSMMPMTAVVSESD